MSATLLVTIDAATAKPLVLKVAESATTKILPRSLAVTCTSLPAVTWAPPAMWASIVLAMELVGLFVCSVAL